MDALELLKAVISELRVMQFDPLQRSVGEHDAGYRNGHNDGVRAAIAACEAHRGVRFACTRGCGWNTSATGKEVDRLMLRYGCCPACKQKDGTHSPVEMAEVVL
jgi:hypothetical protein